MAAGDLKAGSADDEIDFLSMLRVLRGGWRWITIAMVVALVCAVIFLLRAQPLFQAKGLIQLEERGSAALALPEGVRDLVDMGGGSKGSSIEGAEMEILRSRMVIGRAVQALDLQSQVRPTPLPLLGRMPKKLGLDEFGFGLLRSYDWGGSRVEIGPFSVPEEWEGQPFTLRALEAGRYELETPEGEVLQGQVGVALKGREGFSLIIAALDAREGREFQLWRDSLPVAVALVQSNFTVASAGNDSMMLRVSMIDPSPLRAERILDAISAAYVEQNIARSSAQAESSLVFIEEQLPRAREAVAQAQQRLNDYQQKQESVDVDYETRTLLESATKIEADLNALSLQEDELKKRYTPSHPAYETLRQNQAALQRQLRDIRAATSELPETQKEIFNLTRDLEVSQQVYVQLLNRMQELQVMRASTVGSVRVIDKAYAPEIKISPKTKIVLIAAMALGTFIGMAAVFVHRALNMGVRGAQEIETLGLPVFATINFSEDAVDHRMRKGALPILALAKPDDLVTEGLRSLRTSLHFGMLDAKTNTISITSAAPGAGKSFTAVNFAVVVAQAGQSVCVVDADMRKGYLRRYFNKERDTAGLADLIAGEKTIDEVLIKGPVEGLHAICSGRYPPNPSELLMRAEFETLLADLAARFDLVILDCPPTLAVTDPVVVGRYTGATIVVVRHMETMSGEIEAVQHAFEQAGVKLTGAILNGYKIDEGLRYGGQYQYYNYRYSHKSDSE